MSLMRVLQDAFCSIKCIIADGGYRGEVISSVFKKFDYVLQVVLRKRTFSWFERQKVCYNYELLMESAEEMVKLSAIRLLLNKF